VKVLLFGHEGKVGRVLAPALVRAGHEVEGTRSARAGFDAAVDFTRPDEVEANVAGCIEAGIPCVIGTSGFDIEAVDERARAAGVPCFYAPNFAIGAVLMMQLAEQAARVLPRAEIVELHGDEKRDAPSGTARATAERLGGDVPIHSVRLPGLVAHQEVLLGGEGQLLSIRHDAFSREAYVPGVLLALDAVGSMPPGLTVGLERILPAT
jgi:4-hydroxy-tetrahydrodipicolinate reductase